MSSVSPARKNMYFETFLRNISYHQGDNIKPRHLYCHLKAHRVRGRNTENLIKELDLETANYQRNRYVVMKFIHDEKHIVFNDVGKGKRKKEVYDGVEVNVAVG